MQQESHGIRDLRVVIIGAGMSGVLMAIRLKQAGIGDFTLYEKGAEIGGTWRENQYPGLHCDVPSHHYCYSFDPNPDWSSHFSPGPEIRRYFEASAARFGVTSAIRFNTAVTSARWLDHKWHISLSTGEVDVADILISAVGVLHHPTYPAIPGLASFAGAAFHTSRWNETVQLPDKRIGIIGTGSTAVQVVTELAGRVKQLTLFQRTPQWVAKAPNPTFSETRKAHLRKYPFLMKWMYRTVQRELSVLMEGGVMGGSPAVRQGLIDNVAGNLAGVRDPVLRAKLTPDYEVGCKRLVMSPGFYEAIQKPDTSLVTERIERIEPAGIRTADGALHELDVLVMATGFDPGAFMRPMELHGTDGVTLGEVWSERPIAYHSMAIPHMPNFFMLEGPFSPIGNLSLVLISEWQADYIMRCIGIIGRDRVAISPTIKATLDLVARYREKARSTIWATGGCSSWYQDKEGVPIIYPFSANHFRSEIDVDPDLGDFVIEHILAAA